MLRPLVGCCFQWLKYPGSLGSWQERLLYETVSLECSPGLSHDWCKCPTPWMKQAYEPFCCLHGNAQSDSRWNGRLLLSWGGQGLHVLINDRSILNISLVSDLIPEWTYPLLDELACYTSKLCCITWYTLSYTCKLSRLLWAMETQEYLLTDYIKDTIKTVGNQNLLAQWDSCVVVVVFLAHWQQKHSYKQPDCIPNNAL